MLAKMRQLGILPSFSRPRVSDDNAFAEAFFRHLKYAPSWPTKPFASLELAREWVSKFVRWYNEEHRHSGIQFVTPVQRHTGKEAEVLEARARVYAEAKARSPKRWSRRERDWTPAGEVALTAPSRRGPSKGRKGAATVNALYLDTHRKRLLELSPAKWRETRKKLVEAELAMPLGPLTVPK